MAKTLLFLLLATVVLTTTPAAEAQQPKKTARIGILTQSDASFTSPQTDAFRQGLRDLGYVEGKNITFEHRYAEGKLDHLPALAGELVRLKVDVIVAISRQFQAACWSGQIR
jgi:putative ABC transport system substrate-binding protein